MRKKKNIDKERNSKHREIFRVIDRQRDRQAEQVERRNRERESEERSHLNKKKMKIKTDRKTDRKIHTDSESWGKERERSQRDSILQEFLNYEEGSVQLTKLC